MIRTSLRRFTLALTVLALAVTFSASSILAQGSGSKDGGWIDLIKKGDNGQYNKHGWNHYGPGYFSLDRDAGVLKSHDGMGMFWYGEQMFGDFVLELDFMVDDVATNSGIFIRIPYVPVSNQYIYDCFEIQIYDAALDASKKHVLHEGANMSAADNPALHVTGAIYDAKAPEKFPSKPVGEWNKYRITLKGLSYKVELNGELVNEWEVRPSGKVATHWPKGYIGLQNHDATSSVYFRNIRVMPL
jgi:3-keto-disaccharide hydrolase